MTDDSVRSVALVTGSSRGIGYGIARGLLTRGFDVVLNARDEQQLATSRRRLVAECAGTAARGAVHAMGFDVTDPEAVKSAVNAIEADIGPLGALVNNAGIVMRGPLVETALDQWDRTLRTNVTGAFLVGTAVAERMIPRGHGKIVNIGSVQSAISRAGLASYAAAKGALGSLTRSMCVEWGRHNIQVNAVAPGYIHTDMNRELHRDPMFSDWLQSRTPAGRWGTVEDVVGPVMWLCSPQSDFVNGQVVYVDGGVTAAI